MGRLLAWVGGVALVAACDFSNMDLTGRPCPCLDGSFVCDTASNRCVPLVVGDSEGGAAGFSFRVVPDTIRLGLGKTGTLHVTVTRQPSFHESLVVGALNPPPSVTVPPVTIPPDTSEVDLAISAATDAHAGSVVDITLAATGAGESATTTLKAQIVGAPGDIDTTFGNGGVKVENHLFTRLLEQPDGKILALDDRTFDIFRFNADGSVDNGFGASGEATIHSFTNSVAKDLALLPDGRIVVLLGYSLSGQYLFGAVVLTANGNLDPTFGTGGTWTLDSTYYGSGEGVAVQGDGKIVIGGTTYHPYPSTLPSQLIAARIDANGTLDATFGSSGVVNFGDGYGFGLALQGDGKPVLTGSTDRCLVVRYLPNGTLDPSFGSAGVVLDSQMGICSFPKIQTTGHVVALQFDPDHDGPLMTRYASTGMKDSSFGTAGLVTTTDEWVWAWALQADDKIVTGGYANLNPPSADPHTAIHRFTAGGQPDDTFAPQGRITLASRESVRALIVLRDGRALVSLPHPNGLDGLLSRIWM